MLDPALLRPGRFDRQVVLDRPDMQGRMAILEVHAKGKPLDKAVDLKILAKQTPGFSGADLANLVNEAAILAARRNKKSIGMSELRGGRRPGRSPVRSARAGSSARKRRRSRPTTRRVTPSCQRILPQVDPVHKVSIIARGMAWRLHRGSADGGPLPLVQVRVRGHDRLGCSAATSPRRWSSAR